MLFYVTIFFGVIIDLVSKYFAKIYLQKNRDIFYDFLFLKYIENKGIAFSINIPFLKIITLILIFGIFYYYFKEERKKNDKFIDLAFGLILAGAIGNGIERIFNSFVIDFIGVKYFSIFNLADSFIFVGACIYLWRIFIEKNKKI
ncbi:signal peptidase II [Candidatus Gracilibacteria bacterium]|nr:MAG: signal peptidase II [Candidatus Gracilibacteria bacterium]